jgi:hypothetical protein
MMVRYFKANLNQEDSYVVVVNVVIYVLVIGNGILPSMMFVKHVVISVK